jgi:hypothetical protein
MQISNKAVRFMILMLASGFMVTSACGANILLNSDMEEGPEEALTSFPLTFGGWTAVKASSSAYYLNSAAMHSGTGAVQTSRGDDHIWQCATVVGGQQYEVSAWAYPLRASGVEWDATQNALVDVIWFTASSATMADYASRISEDRVIEFHPVSAEYNTWSQLTGTITAPENANCMIIKVGHKSLGGNCVRPDCRFDDVTMSTVPDPATLGLMLLGGSSVLLRRK